ncbi:hypothetical protein A3A70_01680 [candidate division WWE3 bacterium RIFCSPLOWO2_01_FULL_42_11]|uniref:Type II secretion system protein GspG C-terminal domain-containing protein n=1 Tax=candidate division WWE3 bacterium RIFCSPLOWO2_01_FULL_42_11 TaxID=1802627 RepID=A0A1F4VRJ0_UNCKA|nr:MAG: hypothetical protein A3A70_01680 [candidate division WWE3 bacterium RIFCSPLOWO2_01_FULL_42_11]
MTNKIKQGFTLIELLIVIAVIAILAVAVLSAINPVEQVGKANDARKQADATQVLSAIQRYYTTKGTWPWAAGPTQGACLYITTAPAACGDGTVGATNMQDLALLESNNEVDANFKLHKLADLYINTVGTYPNHSRVFVCYSVASKQRLSDSVYSNKTGTVVAIGTGTFHCVPE